MIVFSFLNYSKILYDKEKIDCVILEKIHTKREIKIWYMIIEMLKGIRKIFEIEINEKIIWTERSCKYQKFSE